MVWRKSCTRAPTSKAPDFSAWGDGGNQHCRLDYPARNKLVYHVRIDRSMIHPASANTIDWSESLEAASRPILQCLTIVISFCPFCTIKIMAILLITVHLKLLYFSIWTAQNQISADHKFASIPVGLDDSVWFMLHLYCRKDLQQDIYRKSICRRILLCPGNRLQSGVKQSMKK